MPQTANIYQQALRRLFAWLVDEGEIRQNPLERMRLVRVSEEPPPLLNEEQLRKLFATCERDVSFEGRRDYALLRFMLDTGARRAEVAGLRWDAHDPEKRDIDLGSGLVRLMGKGRRPRIVSVGAKTARALDRYLRRRAERRYRDLPWFWLGQKGMALSGDGIAQIVRRRGRQAGIANLHPHTLRHVFAHRWLAHGALEGDLMRLAGWRTRGMLDRYGAAAQTERALAAQKRLGMNEDL